MTTNRAQEIGYALLGTCEELSAHATENEINNSEFCLDLDLITICCERCG